MAASSNEARVTQGKCHLCAGQIGPFCVAICVAKRTPSASLHFADLAPGHSCSHLPWISRLRGELESISEMGLGVTCGVEMGETGGRYFSGSGHCRHPTTPAVMAQCGAYAEGFLSR